MRQSNYVIGGEQKQIRKLSGPLFQNINIKISKDTKAIADFLKLNNNTIPTGTIVNKEGIPVNDNTAFGIVYNDLDFTNSRGTEILSVCIFGFLDLEKIIQYSKVTPTEEAKVSMNMIKFL